MCPACALLTARFWCWSCRGAGTVRVGGACALQRVGCALLAVAVVCTRGQVAPCQQIESLASWVCTAHLPPPHLLLPPAHLFLVQRRRQRVMTLRRMQRTGRLGAKQPPRPLAWRSCASGPTSCSAACRGQPAWSCCRRRGPTSRWAVVLGCVCVLLLESLCGVVCWCGGVWGGRVFAEQGSTASRLHGWC